MNSRKQELKDGTPKQQNETADLKKNKVPNSTNTELINTLGIARNKIKHCLMKGSLRGEV